MSATRRRGRRLRVGVLAAGVVLATAAVSVGGVDDAPAPPPRSSPAFLIKHGWDIPSPTFVRDHRRSMRKMPFDGVVIQLPGLSAAVLGGAVIPRSRFDRALAPLDGVRLGRLRHNFVIVYAPARIATAADAGSLRNVRRLARSARRAGLAGIAFDNEHYHGPSASRACPDRALERCRRTSRRHGHLVMDAIQRVWPTVDVLVFLGAWVSEPRTAAHLRGVVPYADVARSVERTGPFVVGMVAAAVGTRARVVDGGEIYAARTGRQFRTVRSWQEHGMPASSALVPAALRPRWAETVSAGFGVFDRPFLSADMDPSRWTTTLTNALQATERYVWAYTERHDWWGTGWPRDRVPRVWVDATRAARVSARLPS